jgi:hypothetical protein
VIGVGALAELTDLTTAGVVFTAAVAATALAVVAMETAAERRPATAG